LKKVVTKLSRLTPRPPVSVKIDIPEMYVKKIESYCNRNGLCVQDFYNVKVATILCQFCEEHKIT